MKKLHEFCTVEGCGRKHKARGYCATHYLDWKRNDGKVPTGIIKSRERNKPECCSVEGCTSEVKAKGLCRTHYQRSLRHGHTRYTDRKKPPKICMVPNCECHVYSKEMCHTHYIKNRLWKKFGFTMIDYVEMHHAQNGGCKICGNSETSAHAFSGKVKELALDHCHKTNVVRGLLCGACNTAIGLMREDPKILESAINYLKPST